MYCPIDGDEFLEGITRCPEHDVDLVEDPPELEEGLSWVDRFNDRTAVRLLFALFVISALTYALSGVTTAVIFLLIQLREWEAFETAEVFNQVQAAAFPVAIAALGGLAGALLLRAYLLLSEGGTIGGAKPAISDDDELTAVGGISASIMRLLFALTVVFALLWAGTGIATSREQVKYRFSFGLGSAEEKPEDSFITLQTLNYVGYTGGVASLAIMGAGLMLRTHDRGRRRANPTP